MKTSVRHRRRSRVPALLACAVLGAAALLLATSGCGYRDLGDTRSATAAQWQEIGQIYGERSRQADAALQAVSATTGIDPTLITAARAALTRAAGLPAQVGLLAQPEGIDAFKRNQGELTGLLFRVVVAAQQVPALRDDPAVQGLRRELVQAETRLAAARERYRAAAARHNALAQSFPSAITARLFGYGALPDTL